MTRPVILDLFCGAGGAAAGYHRAGFDALGVDIRPQPYYPFPMVVADAMTYPIDRVDAVHASPPCQDHSTLRNRSPVAHNTGWMLAATLERLAALDVPWVVENVPGAARKMPNAFVLSGGMFGLGTHRPRHFCSNMLILLPPRARPPVDHVAVYGKAPDGRRLWDRTNKSIHRCASSLAEAQEAMGMHWADWHGTKEAIPPAYTEWIGAQLIGACGR